MPTIRKQIVDAAIAALNNSPPSGVPAADDQRLQSYTPTELPAITVFELTEESALANPDSPWGYFLRRELTLRVEIRAIGDPARVVLDPLISWVGKALGGNAQFGGLAEDCYESRTNWVNADADHPYAMVEIDFRITFLTLKTDPTTAGG